MTRTPRQCEDGPLAELDSLGLDVQRLLLAVDTGIGWPLAMLADALDRDEEALRGLVERARESGVLDGHGRLLPETHRAIRTVVPTDRRVEVYHGMVRVWAARGGPVLPLARALLGTGMTGTHVGAACHAAGREAARDDPATAAHCYAAAAAAGRPVRGLLAEWAMACAHAGDLNQALSLADRMISDGAEDGLRNRIAGAQVAAAALAHRGQLDRSAVLYRWSGSPAAVPLATVGLLGVGRRDAAGELLDAAPTALPPTSRDGSFTLLAQGVRESVTGTTTDALATLARSATLLEPAGREVLLPDSPAAVAALVGLHGGELAVAESVLQRALAVGMGGSLLAVRHRLLLAWIAMARGEFTTAREGLQAATGDASPLELRDWLFAVGLEVGLARRTSNPVALRRVWAQASEAVLRHPVDLFSLLPLGELITAAARVGDSPRLAPHLRTALELLHALGDPPLWSAPLHWSCLHAAVIAERPALAREHVAALAGNAGHCEYCSIVHAAAQRWAELAEGNVDATAVVEAAQALHDVGQWWDGAQLAGQAAVRTTDREAMVSLLNCARLLQGKPAKSAPAEAPEPRQQNGEQASDPTSLLSERERQVATLVLDGLTYKQVGESLFISAKTVEHHMARMRRRLNCETRAQLLELISDGAAQRRGG